MNKLIILLPLALVACSSDQEDLRGWMAREEAGMRRTVDPLPEIQPFAPVDYEVSAMASPFSPEKFVSSIPVAGGPRPDVNRQREPLEAYPIESLKMVGSMMKDGVAHALVDAAGNIYQVRAGNYMGQNFGVVTDITETEIQLKELVEDLNGDWVERTSALYLQEQQETTQ